MRLLLSSNPSRFIVNTKLELCSNLGEIYKILNSINKEDKKELYIFVDDDFISKDILHELEIIKYEFEDFRIIVSDIYETLVLAICEDSNIYAKTRITDKANDLFVNMQDLDDENPFFIEDLLNSYKSKDLMKNMVEFDFESLSSCIHYLIKKNNVILEDNLKLKTKNRTLEEQRDKTLETLRKILIRHKELERQFSKMVEDNLLLKYRGFLDDIGSETINISTPLVYIKCILSSNENKIIQYFKILNEFMRTKYNLNTTLIVIEDFNRMKLSKLIEDCTYVSTDGKYNPSQFSENIITTSHHISSLMSNLEGFSGVKDCYIILDLTCSTRTFVLGSGLYYSILNDRVSEGIKERLSEVESLNEEEILNCLVGEGINLKMNVTRSESFKKIENSIKGLIEDEDN